MAALTPLIGVTACTAPVGRHVFHMAGDKYLQAATLAGLPVILPALGGAGQDELLAHLDGLLLTGAYSNIEPHHYQALAGDEPELRDPARDATTLSLIRKAVAAGIPVFGICRGFQEMNVAYGGTLHQKVHQVPGLQDHREPAEQPLEIQYGPSHPVRVLPGGLLAALAPGETVEVNSLHGQGVERLGDGLRAEAVAADGLVEAFSVTGAERFALGVQWHPEWQVRDNPFYLQLFRAFAAACTDRARSRTGAARNG